MGATQVGMEYRSGFRCRTQIWFAFDRENMLLFPDKESLWLFKLTIWWKVPSNLSSNGVRWSNRPEKETAGRTIWLSDSEEADLICRLKKQP